jgi:hypothetical protein
LEKWNFLKKILAFWGKNEILPELFGNFWDFIHKAGEKFSKIIDPFSPKSFP